eukprot:12519815-Alexandrium_andersonii.AAC.1
MGSAAALLASRPVSLLAADRLRVGRATGAASGADGRGCHRLRLAAASLGAAALAFPALGLG